VLPCWELPCPHHYLPYCVVLLAGLFQDGNQVLIKTTKKDTTKKGAPDCVTPAPTPFSPFQVYADDQRCLEALPIAPVSSPDDCYRACYGSGLEPTFYFAVTAGVCYGCQSCTLVYDPGFVTLAGLVVPPTTAPTKQPTKTPSVRDSAFQ
jgi:hypothetical protein